MTTKPPLTRTENIMRCVTPFPDTDPDWQTCDFDPDPDEPDEESTHYLRTCPHCNQQFWSLHCACDGHTANCPHCNRENTPIPCPCEKETT